MSGMGLPAGRAALRMRWENLLFLHWRWPVEELKKVLPAGLEPESFDGSGWLGVVPFRMCRVYPVGLVPVPWLSDFLELNVRTYVTGPDGSRGVWFFSLACNQPVATWLARTFFRLNYVHARMEALIAGGEVKYRCNRRGVSSSRFCYPDVAGSEHSLPAEAGSLEEFLVERYVLFSVGRGGGIFSGRVHHEPYRVFECERDRFFPDSFLPAVDDGFVCPGRPPDHALVAETVDVRAWPIRRVA